MEIIDISEYEQDSKGIFSMVWLALIVDHKPHATYAMIDLLR